MLIWWRWWISVFELVPFVTYSDRWLSGNMLSSNSYWNNTTAGCLRLGDWPESAEQWVRQFSVQPFLWALLIQERGICRRDGFHITVMHRSMSGRGDKISTITCCQMAAGVRQALLVLPWVLRVFGRFVVLDERNWREFDIHLLHHISVFNEFICSNRYICD